MPNKDKLPKKVISRHPLSLIFLASCLFIFIFSSIFSFLHYKSAKSDLPNIPEQSIIGKGCKISGCNKEICQNEADEGGYSICIYKKEFDCYKSAKCEVQNDENCGWTQTTQLKTCLEENKDPESGL